MLIVHGKSNGSFYPTIQQNNVLFLSNYNNPGSFKSKSGWIIHMMVILWL